MTHTWAETGDLWMGDLYVAAYVETYLRSDVAGEVGVWYEAVAASAEAAVSVSSEPYPSLGSPALGL